MLTEQPKRSHELSKWYKMSNWRLVCRNHDFHKKRSPIYGLKNFCLIVKWRNCLKKSFWNIAAKLKLRVKHEWQKKRDFGEDREGSTDRDWHQKPPKNHLPTSLPCCLSWQTSDLGLSEWEQLKLVAWLDLASQDQVTAASRSSKPVHQKHGHLVPTPGDWWPVPAVRAAKRRSRSCWMNWSHSTAECYQPPPQHQPTLGPWSMLRQEDAEVSRQTILSRVFWVVCEGVLSSPSSPVL